MMALLQKGQKATEAALFRGESRGAHFRTDFPQTLPKWQRRPVFRENAAKRSSD